MRAARFVVAAACIAVTGGCVTMNCNVKDACRAGSGAQAATMNAHANPAGA